VPWPHIRGSAAAVRSWILDQRPDVVHVHLSVLSPLGILAVRAAARNGVPVVVTVHSLWWWAASLYRTADRLMRWGAWPVHWTAVSDLAAEPLRGILGDRAEVEVLPNGVDAAAWAVDPLPRDDREVVVASVMRLALRKRPKALMHIVRDAAAALPEGIRLRVVVVGDGPQRRAVRRLRRRYRLTDCVELAGRRDHAGIRELYRRADLYLAPATLESFGIAALEARCAGLPVLARRRTGIAGFVHDGVDGLLADDDAGLARGLARLATDPDLRAEMTRHNRTRAADHGWPEVLTRCDMAYKHALETTRHHVGPEGTRGGAAPA
jgi:glycosyltransferase involved in cell wall biosynthesis